MKHHITGRAIALAAGVISTLCALGILLEDVASGAAEFSLKHALVIGIVSLAIFFGHLVVDAWRARHALGVVGFAVLFLVATGLVVYKSTGRQAEHTFQSQAEADLAAEQRATTKAAVARSEARLAEAQASLVQECKSGRGPKCRGIEAAIEVHEAILKGHRADLDRIGPPKPITPEADNFAALAAVFGAEKEVVKAGSVLVVPFLTTLLFELGSILCLGFAFRHRPVKAERPSAPATDVSGQSDFPVIDPSEVSNVIAFIRPTDDDPKPPKRSRSWRREEALADIAGKMRRGDAFPSQREMARTYGVPNSTLSDWLNSPEAERFGIVRRTEGRRKAVAAG
ncbi:hypothetical protein [Hyphomicrobium sp.]|uniref:hypothetical protein n=1 Tax=Hyphomicrobium sp. TaxID=82 RepID=UPI002FE0C152